MVLVRINMWAGEAIKSIVHRKIDNVRVSQSLFTNREHRIYGT